MFSEDDRNLMTTTKLQWHYHESRKICAHPESINIVRTTTNYNELHCWSQHAEEMKHAIQGLITVTVLLILNVLTDV